MLKKTGTVCGYCGHVRALDSLAPEWQCPSCETAYAKASGRREKEQFPGRFAESISVSSKKTSAGSGFTVPAWVWLGAVLLGIVFTLSRYVTIEKHEEPAPAVAAPAGEVWVFSRNGCGYCRKEKEFLREKGYAFTELDLDNDSNARELYSKLNVPGVPVTLVGEKMIYGYQPDLIEKAIKKAKK